MDWVGAATAGAAGLAAVFAGANLYLSPRQDLDKWTRETLIEVLTAFLDASFAHSSACRNVYRHAPDLAEHNELRNRILAAHSKETEALTRLRILAPPSVVEAALILFEAEYQLSEPCFIDDTSADPYEALILSVRQRRALFIEAARSALGLRKITGTGSYESTVRWSTLRRLLRESELDATANSPQKVAGQHEARSADKAAEDEIDAQVNDKRSQDDGDDSRAPTAGTEN
jgi:hypothetical protein